MPRSYDNRRYPKGPNVEPGGESVLRGPKRIGPIRGIVPGDDIEVARDIARLWEWHYRLERQARRAASTGGDAGNFGCFTSKVLDQEDEDLVLYYDMQETSGALQDRSGNSRHATVVGTPGYQDTDAPYPSEPSLLSIDFSPATQETATDTNDHFVLPATPVAFGGVAPFTIEVVGRHVSIPATRKALVSAIATNGTSGWYLSITNAGVFEAKRGTVTLTVPASMSLQVGDWYHVALKFDGTNLYIVHMGAQVAKVATSLSITASTVAYLGRVKLTATNYYYDDEIGSVAIWSRAVPNAELAARAACLFRTGSGDPDSISTDPDGRPPLTVYTLTGNAFSGAEMVLHKVSDNPNGGYVRIPRMLYWYNRGWRLLARGAFNDVDGGPNLALGVASEQITVGQATEALIPSDSYFSYDITSPWVMVNRDLGGLDEDDTVSWYTYMYKSTDLGGDTVSVGTQTVQLYWVTSDEAAQIIQEQDIPAGSAASDILEWDGTSWVPDKLENANVDAAAAIAYSKLNLASSIVNADVAAGAAIAYAKLNLAAAIVNADVAAGAAIAYAKLNLAAAIVNADIAAAAAIAKSKIAPGGSLQFDEMADPTGIANAGLLYTRDNGAGKTQLCVIFGSGAVQVISTEP